MRLASLRSSSPRLSATGSGLRSRPLDEPFWPCQVATASKKSSAELRVRLACSTAVVQPVEDEESLAGPLVEEPVQGVVHLAAGDAEAEVFGRDRFERVGLVEDDDVVLGQEAGPGAAEGEVGEEQGVVDDEDVGRPHPLSGREVEAVAEPGALLAQAVAVLAGHRVPDRPERLEVEVRPATVLRLAGPVPDLGELVELLGPGRKIEPPAGRPLAASSGGG